MAKTKLSTIQLDHLRALRNVPGRGSYPGLSLGTLQSLQRRRLVRSEGGLGSMAFPHTSVKWFLTPLGRALVSTDRSDPEGGIPGRT